MLVCYLQKDQISDGYSLHDGFVWNGETYLLKKIRPEFISKYFRFNMILFLQARTISPSPKCDLRNIFYTRDLKAIIPKDTFRSQ